MSQNLLPLNFEGQSVRVVADDSGEPLWVGKDVCEVLGHTNHNKAMQDHCKGVTIYHPLQTAGGVQEMRVLKVPDVLRLITGSTLPAAERFESWVFDEVLPTIIETGAYAHPGAMQPANSLAVGEAKALLNEAIEKNAGYLTMLAESAHGMAMDAKEAANSVHSSVRDHVEAAIEYLVLSRLNNMDQITDVVGKRVDFAFERLERMENLLRKLEDRLDSLLVVRGAKARGPSA